MGDKLGGIFIIIVAWLLLATFGAYVYLFTYGDGDIDANTVENQARVLGSVNAADSNFVEPEDITYGIDPLFSEEMIETIKETDDPRGKYDIRITKLSVENNPSHTNDLEILHTEGWMILPWSYIHQDSIIRFPPWKPRLPKTDPVIVCYRRFYGKTNAKTCWNLDSLEKDDEILFDENLYKVHSITIRPKDQENIFNSGETGDWLKLITNSGPNGEAELNTNYLIIMAEKVVAPEESTEE